ncbi:hypothetical protein PILCRDRAFT_73495, partial [Piloderma croceum F 1598]
KFFPRYDSPYTVIDTHPETSNYTLELPNSPNTFPTFHSSELKPHFTNDCSLFPLHKMAEPQPVFTNQVFKSILFKTLSTPVDVTMDTNTSYNGLAMD